jgi:hypothetical protein
MKSYSDTHLRVVHVLQGKNPLADIFVEAPIKISQKIVYSGGEQAEVLADIFLRCFYKYITH